MDKIKIFSLQTHTYIEPVSVTSGNKYNTIDWRLTTKCIATSTEFQEYIFDRYPQDEAAYDAGRGKPSGSTDWDWGGLVIANYAEIDAYGHPANWEGAFVRWLSSPSPANPGGNQYSEPIANVSGSFFASKETANDISKRYIVVRLIGAPVAAKISHFLFMKEHELEIRPQYTLDTTYIHDTKEQKLSGGDRVVILQAQNSYRELKRNFTILGGATKNSIVNWYNESAGATRFVVYLENVDIITDAIICRLNKSQLNIKETKNELFVTGLNMREVPQYLSGEDW